MSYHYNDMESSQLVSQGIRQEHIYFVIAVLVLRQKCEQSHL